MKRTISTAFKAARHDMRSRLIQCHDCTDYATELHHVIAIEDGGTDDILNLMPLCRSCHKEYTSGQTIERNQMWVSLSVKDDEVTAQIKGGPVESLGRIGRRNRMVIYSQN
jgi:5-methylcytosine-specific restriction endonuclease McrA